MSMVQQVEKKLNEAFARREAEANIIKVQMRELQNRL